MKEKNAIESWINKTISIRTKKGFNYKGILKSLNLDLKIIVVDDFKTKNEFCIPFEQIEEFRKIDMKY